MLESWIGLNALITCATLLVEALVGYPMWLHSRIPHPVVWAGNAINYLERTWNRTEYSFAKRRLLGVVAVFLLVIAALLLGTGLEFAIIFADIGKQGANGPDGFHGAYDPSGGLVTLAVLALVSSVGLAQKSLFIHVKRVLTALRAGDLAVARERVSHIVGRDTRQLDAGGVSAAALESLAESFNDGVVAPTFWLAVGGLPGLFVYKVLNTADSLIGHKEARWRAFGWAAARADDVANLVPARIAGALLTIAGWGGLLVMFKDAGKHASPNAGWPEAAMAGALGVRLGGPTTYDGVLHERPVFGVGPMPGAADLARGLRVYVIACGLLWLLALWLFTCMALSR